jgi:hypothetical protein
LAETFQLRGLGREVSRDELEIIKFDDLLKYSVSPGFIFYLSNDTKKPFLLLNPGDVVEREFIDKYQAKGMRSFYILKIVKNENVNELMKLFEAIKLATFDGEKDKARSKILNHVSEVYWLGSKEGAVLDLVIALNRVFYRLDQATMDQIKNISQLAYVRSLIMGTIGVITALCDDVNDFEILSDIYHACILLDYGMMDNDFSYSLGQAIEEERIHPGQGLTFIEKNALNKNDVLKFQKHPIISYKKIKVDCNKAFYHQHSMRLINFHHELNDGTGFPAGLIGGELRTIQSIPIFVDHLVPNSLIKFREKDGLGWLKKLFEKNIKDIESSLPIKRLVKKVLLRMEPKNEMEQTG